MSEADLEHIAEEIEDMGKSQRAGVRSRLITLLAHLLKWQYEPSHQSRSWKDTIARERVESPLAFEDSPSLRRYAIEDLPRAYAAAVKPCRGEHFSLTV